MKKLVLAAVCVATLSAFGTVGASAQMTAPAGQQTMHNGMNSNARMMHRNHMKRHMMRRHMMHKRMGR